MTTTTDPITEAKRALGAAYAALTVEAAHRHSQRNLVVEQLLKGVFERCSKAAHVLDEMRANKPAIDVCRFLIHYYETYHYSDSRLVANSHLQKLVGDAREALTEGGGQ